LTHDRQRKKEAGHGMRSKDLCTLRTENIEQLHDAKGDIIKSNRERVETEEDVRNKASSQLKKESTSALASNCFSSQSQDSNVIDHQPRTPQLSSAVIENTQFTFLSHYNLRL